MIPATPSARPNGGSVGGPSGLGPTAPATTASALPSGPGKELVETRCAVCHNLERVTVVKRQKRDWETVVANMYERWGMSAPDEVKAMIGVFSSSATLLPTDQLNRVPGAIDAGVDIVTAGSRDTDIAQDFAIGSLKIRIPAGAKYLFVAAPDNFSSDNADPDADYAVRIALY